MRQVLVIAAFLVSCSTAPGLCQDARLTLPGASGETAIFDGSNNLVVETHTVPAGYMDLWRAYDGSYRDPVVLVEGFDPLNETEPFEVYSTMNVLGAADTIRAAGRSAWIVNFGDGAGALSANAQLMSSAVSQAANYGGLSNARVDVIGLSMGGVISRYALAYDEQHSGPSDGLIRVWISGDSPQQGANGNPSVQELAMFTEDPVYVAMIQSDAALSMMYISVRSYSDNGCTLGALPDATNWVGSTAAHDWFYTTTLNALNGDGYPHKSRNVAVANGSWDPQPYAVGSPLFDARTYLTWPFRIQLCSERYNCYAADVAAGSIGNSFAPGNIREPNFELDQHFVPTFVPTLSALDVRQGVSKFDRTLVQTTAQDHGTITEETNVFILEELLGAGWQVNPRVMPDGAKVYLRAGVVSAVFNGRFYVQSPDRTWGIAVVSAAGVTEGNEVTVIGTLQTTNGEREIAASSVHSP